ncbi:Os02g0324200 [Oryza sativa Japonica Group]|jgi:hypothetical protein|uniref:Os02g0324200 protein n=2 Tax=Oryza TaxID=4527 RepID=A0A0P0VIB0_ORYSJ|nr:hypothetical protein EE612_010857 [Oryza sativa]KAF2944486.1 hypothetical protein DAI22_02g146400 [Oryza sativa Japonica Group]BAS78397.1 Os02g0324200 [Oryza sativa Japonica Group]
MEAASWPPGGRRSGLGDGVSCAAGTHLSLAIFLRHHCPSSSDDELDGGGARASQGQSFLTPLAFAPHSRQMAS